MTNNQISNRLKKYLGEDRVEENKDLFPYLTLRTHTKAKYFFIAKTKQDLQNTKKASVELNIPLLFIGGGSNVAILETFINRLVVKNEYIRKKIIKEDNNSVTLFFSSGYPMSIIVSYTTENGYEGFEYQKGLPGTLGGAIAMNSKWTKPYCYVSDTLLTAVLLDKNGDFKKVDKAYFQFAYDYSTLKKSEEIFVEGIFQCNKTNPQILEKRAKEAMDYRLNTQPGGVATCGCFFRNISQKVQQQKNLPTTSVGYLIDNLGLKNLISGAFTISDKHANFIINKGGGNIKDLVKLINIIKEKVMERYGIELEEEVVII